MNELKHDGALLEKALSSCEPLWAKSYDADVRRDYDPGDTTIKQTMLDIMARSADAPFIYIDDEVIARLYADEQANRLGNAMLDLGAQKGERVSLIISNRPEITYGFMACYKTGLVAAAFNQRCTSHEICSSINTVGSSIVIIEQEHVCKLVDALEKGECPSVRSVIVIDAVGKDLKHAGEVALYSYDSLLDVANPSEPAIEVGPCDNAIILFTGGTTGVSKGVCATHADMVREIKTMHHWAAPALTTPDPKVLICMPLTHIMGINYGVHWQIINGGSCVFAEGVHCDEIIDSFERYHPTMWAALPTLLHCVSLDERLGSCPYKDLEFVIFGGSFISSETLNTLKSNTKACFAESYGMSESFGFVSANPVASSGKLGSVGLPISGIDMLVVDTQDGVTPCKPNERGEIIFRGRQIAKSYWNNPVETAKAIRGGWMYSGDIGYMDDDGFFYVVDRKKDMLVVSGFNVFPKDIDECLMQNPAVADACTIGVPDPHSCERPKSFVVLKEGQVIGEEELRIWCRERLVAYKVPRYVEFIDVIPTTRNRKQDRALLRRQELEKHGGASHFRP